MKLINPAQNPSFNPPRHYGVTSTPIANPAVGAQQAVISVSTLVPGGGAEPDRHPNSEQTFYLLQGQLLFSDGEQQYRLLPGQAVFVGRDELHIVQNDGDEDAVCLVVTAPPV